jgi:8-oxo-dGTP diphosphatase
VFPFAILKPSFRETVWHEQGRHMDVMEPPKPRHRKGLPIVEVTAAILVKGDRVLIAQRPPGDRLAGLWEFPGGKLEDGETLQACLARELQEEFGIAVTVGEALGESVYHYPHLSVRLLAFRTSIVDGTIRPMAHAAVKWVKVSELADHAFAPADRPFVARLANGAIPIQPAAPPKRNCS